MFVLFGDCSKVCFGAVFSWPADGKMAKLPMAQNGKIGQMGQMGQMGNSHCSNFGLKTQNKTKNYFINSDHWNERIAYLHHKEILSNWNHLKMHCLLKFEHISWDSSEKSIICFQFLTNNSKVQTVHQLIDWKIRQSNANNCINPGNNLEQFGGGRMGGILGAGSLIIKRN